MDCGCYWGRNNKVNINFNKSIKQWECTRAHPYNPTRAMTIREIRGIRGNREPMKTVGKARVSRNVDLIPNGVGLDASAPPRRPIGC